MQYKIQVLYIENRGEPLGKNVPEGIIIRGDIGGDWARHEL